MGQFSVSGSTRASKPDITAMTPNITEGSLLSKESCNRRAINTAYSHITL